MIKIVAEFENVTSRTLVPSVALTQTQTSYTHFRMSKKRETRYLALIEGEHLTPRSSGVWDSPMLQIPADTPITLSNCQIMEVEYSLVVSIFTVGSFCHHIVTTVFTYSPRGCVNIQYTCYATIILLSTHFEAITTCLLAIYN